MNYYKNNIRHVKGDTYSSAVVVEGLGQPLDSIFFTCRDSLNDDSQILFEKSLGHGITIVEYDAENDIRKYAVRIAPYDTKDLQPGTYFYDVQIAVNGDVFTIMRGNFILLQDATRKDEGEEDEVIVQIKAELDAINGEVISVDVFDKLDYLNETKGLIKDSLNVLGAEITEQDPFRNYATLIDELYDEWPKTPITTGTEVSLENTKKAKMILNLNGNTEQRILPVEYTPVDYIESSGTQYIDTNYKINSNTTNIKIDFSMNNIDNAFNCLFGYEKAGDNRFFIRFLQSGGLSAYTPNGYSVGNSYSSGKNEITFDIENSRLYINESEINISISVNSNADNFYLFTLNYNGNSVANNISSMKLYSFKIYENDNIVKNFIPCYRNSDNEVGLYDLVNNVFYVNQGTGSFTYGNRVPTPDFPQNIRVATGNNTIKVNTDNYPINLGNLEVCYIPDTSYQDYIYDDNGNWYKHSEIGKLDMSTITSWDKNTDSSFYSIGFVNAYGYKKDKLLSNIFIYSTTVWESGKFGITSSGNLWISTNDNSIQITDNLPNWLSNKNAIMYGALATPKDELITDTTLIEQLNALKNAMSFDDTTNISSEYEEGNAPFIISARALLKD